MEEKRIKITLIGAKEYKKEIQEMKKEAEELREEIDKINLSLEKEAELIRENQGGKVLQQGKDPWKRYAREGYVNSRLEANHKYTRDAILLVENRIKKLENKVATQQKIATLLCEIILFVKLIHFLSQLGKEKME